MNIVFQNIRIRSLLVWMVTVSLIYFIIAIILFFLDSSRILLSLNSILGAWLCLYITPVLWLIVKLKKNTFTFQVLFKSNQKVKIGNIVVLTFMLYIFIQGMAYLWEWFKTISMGLTDPTELPSDNLDGLFKILSIITLVLIAPICEEIIFRGILLGRLTAKYNLKLGIISSSIMFGILHKDFISFALFGILLSILVVKSNTLMAPIIVHIIFNSTSVILDYYFLLVDMPNGFISNLQLTQVFIIAMILIVIGLSWIISFLKKNWSLVINKGYPFN